jgi:hypothetical protein
MPSHAHTRSTEHYAAMMLPQRSIQALSARDVAPGKLVPSMECHLRCEGAGMAMRLMHWERKTEWLRMVRGSFCVVSHSEG